MAWRVLLFAILAPITAPAAAHSAPEPPSVNVRLSPDLGDALPAVRSAVDAMPNVRIAEPADYILTTKFEYPQTLISVDAEQAGRKTGQLDYQPLRVELGNLQLDDYEQPLRDLIAKTTAAKSLIERAGLGGNRPYDIETCIARYEHQPACNYTPGPSAPMKASLDAIPYVNSTVLVRNYAPAPRFVALFLVDPAFTVHRLDLRGHEHGEPVAARTSAETGMLSVPGNPNGKYWVLTFWSSRPFNGDSSGPDLPSADMTGSVAQHHQVEPPLGEMGGGEPVLDAMAPWMAELYSTIPYTEAEKAADALKPADQQEHLSERSDEELAHRCGGSLIAANLVLTAAHCVAMGKYEGDGMAKVLKERRIRLDTKFLGNGGTTFAVAGVAVPADYSPLTKQNDIALLLIKPDRDTYQMTVETLAVGRRPLTAGTRLITYGWGYTGPVPPGQSPLLDLARELQHNPDFLRFGRMAVMRQDKCRERMPLVASGMVCVVARDVVNGGESAHNVFTCRGDSGGPLVRTVLHKDELVGITSWSVGCGYKDFPSVFTDVTKYRSWIDAARQQLKPGAAIRVPQPAAGEANSASPHW
jgi:hypothetical protein